MADDDKKGNSDKEIWVNEFTEKSAQKFREELLKAADKVEERCPIIVRIDSYGGYVDSLAKMLETMDSIRNPIVTSCEGKAMSCGAILLSNGDYRFVGKHSRVLIHEISHGSIGDVHDVHNDAEEGKRINKYFLGLLAKNCQIKGGYTGLRRLIKDRDGSDIHLDAPEAGLRRLIKDRDGRDIHLDAPEAVDFGIADEIGIPTVTPVINYYVGAKGYHSFKFDKSKGKKKTRRRK